MTATNCTHCGGSLTSEVGDHLLWRHAPVCSVCYALLRLEASRAGLPIKGEEPLEPVLTPLRAPRPLEHLMRRWLGKIESRTLRTGARQKQKDPPPRA